MSSIYRFSRGYRLNAIFGLFIFSAFMLLTVGIGLFDDTIHNSWVLYILALIFVFFIRMSINWWKIRDYAIRITDEAVYSQEGNIEKEKIRWEDVSHIREENFKSRLVIYGKNNRSIFIYYYFNDFFDLIKIIQKKLSLFANPDDSCIILERTYSEMIWTLLLIPIAIFVNILISTDYSSYLIITIPLTLALIYEFLTLDKFVELTNDGLIFHKIAAKRYLSFGEIKDIRLEKQQNKGRIAIHAVVEDERGKKYRLYNYKISSIGVLNAINKAKT